jgi:Transcriptional regulator containing PAS, AAA-type ATPase, and DNA-binding domains
MNSLFVITSPSRQFTQMARSVTWEMRFEAEIIEAVLDEAVEKVRAFIADKEVTAIITRGGTAQMLREAVDIPLLNARVNDFDVLSALKRASAYSPKIAYLLSAVDRIDELPGVSDFLQITPKQFPFQSEAEIAKVIHNARREGFEVFVSGSGKVYDRCAALGMHCEIVNTSRRTMRDIVMQAQLLQEVKTREVETSMKIQATFDILPQGVLFLDTDHAVVLGNKAALSLLRNLRPELLGYRIDEYIQDDDVTTAIFEQRSNARRVLHIAGKMVLLHSQPVWVRKEFIGTVLTIQLASELEKQEQTLRRQSHAIGMVAKARFPELEVTAESASMRSCLKLALEYAKTGHTVLIEGESGTGKEMLAQSMHNASSRKAQPFVAINCAALPQSLLESELFGYEGGAFTGAKRGGKPGYFELAHRGTLFLDELGLIPMHVQVQLLRVLQERQVLRVGGQRMIPVDVRIIAATNTDLMEAVAAGSFRQDLFYRMHVLHLRVPPLRHRKEDIRALVKLYMNKYSKELGFRLAGCDQSLLKDFEAYAWPGNVRELANYIMRLVLCARSGELTRDNLREAGISLPRMPRTLPANNPALHEDIISLQPGTMEAMQRDIIQWHMLKYGGSRGKVCECLDICRTTLWKKLR